MYVLGGSRFLVVLTKKKSEQNLSSEYERSESRMNGHRTLAYALPCSFMAFSISVPFMYVCVYVCIMYGMYICMYVLCT